MLFRVSGKLTNGTDFAAKIEAPNAVGAIVTGRKALNDGGKSDDDIAEMRSRPIVGKSAVIFREPKTPEQIAAAKQKRADREKGKNPAASKTVAKK